MVSKEQNEITGVSFGTKAFPTPVGKRGLVDIYTKGDFNLANKHYVAQIKHILTEVDKDKIMPCFVTTDVEMGTMFSDMMKNEPKFGKIHLFSQLKKLHTNFTTVTFAKLPLGT